MEMISITYKQKLLKNWFLMKASNSLFRDWASVHFFKRQKCLIVSRDWVYIDLFRGRMYLDKLEWVIKLLMISLVKSDDLITVWLSYWLSCVEEDIKQIQEDIKASFQLQIYRVITLDLILSNCWLIEYFFYHLMKSAMNYLDSYKRT